MKLYTRTGDDGTTGLFGGGRVPKNHPRVEAFGQVDELNAALGLVAAMIPRTASSGAPGIPAPDIPPLLARLQAILAEAQSRLFDLGADLATPAGTAHEGKTVRVSEAHVTEAEGWIDEIDAGNEPMRQFILPGGTELAARLHLARTICRRAERSIIALASGESISPLAIIYLNRLSDLLFAMARRANREAGVADVPWTPQHNHG